jgi:phage gp36-like protein
MAYCTLAQMLVQYGEPMLRDATDRADAATGDVDEAAVERAIASADALIDGYLKVRYALPLGDTPALVNELSMTIALYKAHPRVADEKVQRDYDNALKLLTQISKGDIKLDAAGAEPASAGTSGVRITPDREPHFTSDKLKGYI